MTHDAIMASWAVQGTLAQRSSFRIVEQDGRLDLIADLAGGGRTLRVFKSLSGDAPDDEVEQAIAQLYGALGGLPARADLIHGRSFSEHLAEAEEGRTAQ
jgi:hypothetical protein